MNGNELFKNQKNYSLANYSVIKNHSLQALRLERVVFRRLKLLLGRPLFLGKERAKALLSKRVLSVFVYRTFPPPAWQ